MSEPTQPDDPAAAEEESGDRFSRGRVARFFPKSRYGFIQDKNGRDVYFNLDEVRFVGPHDHRDLREGAEVGYDLSRTRHGQHVTKLKIY